MFTPLYSSWMDLKPPYVGGGYCGRTLSLNRTKADRGSNPIRSTHDPLNVEVFIMFNPMGGGNITVQQADDENRVQPGAITDKKPGNYADIG